METLTNAIFCPAPTGWWHPDSFRFTEAIEAGCFPLVDGKPDSYDYVIKYYWRDHWFPYFGVQEETKPFIEHIDSWASVPAWIEEQLKDKDALELKRQQMVRWWSGFKEGLTCKLAVRLSQELSRPVVPDEAGRLCPAAPRARAPPRVSL